MSDHSPQIPPPPHSPGRRPPDLTEPAPGRVCWVDLDDAGQAHRTLGDLRAWMGTALVHEAQAVELLRPCWYRRPGVVQTLLDVRAAWNVAHRSDLPETAATDRALEMTERHLPHLETRPARLLARCTSVRHDPPGNGPTRPNESEVAAYPPWWAGERTPDSEPRTV